MIKEAKQKTVFITIWDEDLDPILFECLGWTLEKIEFIQEVQEGTSKKVIGYARLYFGDWDAQEEKDNDL